MNTVAVFGSDTRTSPKTPITCPTFRASPPSSGLPEITLRATPFHCTKSWCGVSHRNG